MIVTPPQSRIACIVSASDTPEPCIRRTAILAKAAGASVHAVRFADATVDDVATEAELGRACGVVRRLEPALVTLDPRLASLAVAIAERLACRTLIGRGWSPGHPVLIASDLGDPRYPVIAAGTWLAQISAAPVTVLHNVTPLPMPGIVEAASISTGARTLDAVSTRFGGIESILTHEPSTAEAIAETARRTAADVIVVGLRRRSWVRRRLGTGLANRFAREANASVLIVPMLE